MHEYAGRYLDAVLTDENGSTLTMKVLVTKANDKSPFGMEMASCGPIKTNLEQETEKAIVGESVLKKIVTDITMRYYPEHDAPVVAKAAAEHESSKTLSDDDMPKPDVIVE